jgi:hypothetical protein
MRGPLVYCLEETDQEHGVNLLDVRAVTAAPLREVWNEDLLGGVMQVQTPGELEDSSAWESKLYDASDGHNQAATSLTMTAIPYYLWANRGKAPMRVWIPEAES